MSAAAMATMPWLRGGIEPGTTVVVYPPPTVKDGVGVKVKKP